MKAEDGSEQTVLYDNESDCKVKARRKRDQSRANSPVSQNVRDPVREKAAQNYQAVLNELKDKFRGLKGKIFMSWRQWKEVLVKR